MNFLIFLGLFFGGAIILGLALTILGFVLISLGRH